MKKKRNLYIIAFLCFITLVGVTIAYLQSTDTFENIFNAGTYSVITHEEFTSPTNWKPGDTTPKTITTKNEGTIPVMVRVKFDESWKDSNDNDLDLVYNNENVSIINLDNENDWILRDGYYYYVNELAPGESTSSLIQSVTFNPNYEGNVTCTFNSTTNSNECSSSDGYMGGTYKLSITTETVQSDRYTEIWENVPIMYDYIGANPCTFEGELVEGAEYVNGQYTYRYRQERGYSDWINISDEGWGVILTDKDSTDPVTTTLCSSINNKPIVSMRTMFLGSQATTLDLSSFDTSNVTNMSWMFYDSQATTLDLSSFDTSNVTDMSLMFACTYVPSIDLSNFNTSNVTNMSEMFRRSRFLNLNLKSFDTSKVTNMYWMFYYSQSATINLSSFDTSKVTDMSSMFYNSQATSLDLSSFDTSNVTEMIAMFECSQATTLDLSRFNTSNVTDMSYMFYDSLATTLDLSNFNTSKVTNMSGMFEYSQATTLDLSSFDTSNVTNTTEMFRNSQATTGYARTQEDADRLNASSNKPSALTFVVKSN